MSRASPGIMPVIVTLTGANPAAGFPGFNIYKDTQRGGRTVLLCW